MKIMIDSGNTVGDLVSEEFAKRMGLDGDEVQDQNKNKQLFVPNSEISYFR